MSVSLSTPVTGSAQTGLTSPTYTIVQDTAPSALGKQWACTALGGTQTGVRTHTATDPFTVTVERPAQFRSVPSVVAGSSLPNVPRNKYVFRIRKGVVPVTGQAPQILNIETIINLPAGADAADPSNVRAAFSLLIGSLSQISAGLGDTAVTGIL